MVNDKKKNSENIYEQITFPKDWDPTSLSDVFDLRRETMVPTGIGNQRYIGLEHIDSGRMKISRYGGESEIRSAKNKFYPDDILYGKLRPYLDKSVLADIKGICSTDILVFKVDKDRILPRYGACLVHTSAFLQYVISTTTGVNHPRTSWSSIGKFRCSIPKLAEQSIIVHALFILQQAIAQQEQIITKTKELKRSLMHRLFTYGLRGEELKGTEIGLMPESWKLTNIGEAYEFTTKPRGIDLSKYKELPFIPMELISENQRLLHKYEMRKSFSSGTYVQKGDLVVAKITPSFENGKQGIVTNIPLDFCYATTEVWPLHGVDGQSNIEYLHYYLKKSDVRNEIAGKMEGSTGRQRVPRNVLFDAKIPLPSYEEQIEISDIFISLDEKIDATESKKKSLHDLFKTMLQLLMTGQVRVKDIDFGEACE